MHKPHLRYKNQNQKERTWTIHILAIIKLIVNCNSIAIRATRSKRSVFACFLGVFAGVGLPTIFSSSFSDESEEWTRPRLFEQR